MWLFCQRADFAKINQDVPKNTKQRHTKTHTQQRKHLKCSFSGFSLPPRVQRHGGEMKTSFFSSFFPPWTQLLKLLFEKSLRRNASEFPRRSCWKWLGKEMSEPPCWGCQSPNVHDFEYVWVFSHSPQYSPSSVSFFFLFCLRVNESLLAIVWLMQLLLSELSHLILK